MESASNGVVTLEGASNNGPSHRQVLFRVRRSIRYHSRRQKHYIGLHHAALLLAIWLGSASIVALATEIIKDWPLWIKLLPAAFVSLFSSADLVFGNEQKIWMHADFVRRFTDLERRLISPEGKKPESIVEIRDKVSEIEATEPPVLHVLNTLCRNELMRAEGFPKNRQIAVGFFQRLFSGFTDFRAHALSEKQASSKT